MNKSIKFITIILLILIFGLLFYFQNNTEKKVEKNKKIIVQPTSYEEQNKVKEKETKKSIFVPYWTLSQNDTYDDYDRVIYFGLSVNDKGINMNDQGYIDLEKFIQQTPKDKQKYLVLRMTNTDENLKILKNNITNIQMFKQLIEISKKYNFDGVALDLEMSVLFGNDVISQINNFSSNLYSELKKENIKYSVAIYGDVFYKIRPYDVLSLAKNSDEIIVMAYDFHKSIGEPGPNFPLNRKNTYSYDFKKMISDYLKQVQLEKLTIVFGLYGYDWIVDEKGRPIKAATALSLNEINTKYLNDCIKPKCEFIIDQTSKENKIEVTDENERKHIIWFENERSVDEKIEYLKTKGIFNYAYWAKGYF